MTDASAGGSARAIKFCGAITSCGITEGAFEPMSNCLVAQASSLQGLGYAPSFVACVLASDETCAAIKLCANGGRTFSACSTPDKFVCIGNVQEACDILDDSGVTWSYDCSQIGATCTQQAGGCSYGPCSGSAYRCEGTKLEECGEGLTPDASFIGFNGDCASGTTATCGRGPDGGAMCIGRGPACSEDRCDGTTWVSCQGGHEATYNCASEGLTCVNAGNDGGATANRGVYCALGNDCGPAQHDVCEGDTLHYCNLGLPASLNCTAAGFGHCSRLPGDQGSRCQR